MPNAAVSRLVLSGYSEPLVAEAARDALHEIGGRVSCGFVFCSADYRENLPDFLEILQLNAHVPILAGCSGSGLIGTAAEAESAQGFTLLLLHLPDTELRPFHFSDRDLPAWEDDAAWRQAAGPQRMDAWMMLADPSQGITEPLLRAWNDSTGGVPVFGGLGSGGADGSDIFVFRDRELLEGGGVLLGFRGGVKIHTLVSQGCRPIGEPLPVTKAEHNVVHTLGSRPAYQVLDEAFQALSEREKKRAGGNLFAGLAIREDREEFHRGDFLIRNILAADESSGAVALGAFPRVGQTLQYQLRDAGAADEDLRHLAGDLAADRVKPFGSLLFSCGGRGRGMFGAPNHDASVLAEMLGPHPSAGFFCNGEIGPIGGRNFVHGYTASAALFCNA
jgi:small ligand-binding sensory domain FIST